MATDCSKSHWPAPQKRDTAAEFKPSRIPTLLPAIGYWDGDDWIQREGDIIVRYVKPLKLQYLERTIYWPNLSNCVAIW